MCIFLRVSVVEERDIASGRTEIPAFRTGSVSCDPGEREGGGYDRDKSTIETAKQTTDEIESETGESGQVDDKSSNEKSQSDSDSDSKENAGGFFSGLFNKVQEGVSTATANVENVLNNFIEALAILLVTSCLIPILVLIFFVWLVKMLLGLNIDIPTSVRK